MRGYDCSRLRSRPLHKRGRCCQCSNSLRSSRPTCRLGICAICPTFNPFWHILFPRPYEFWLELDNQFLPCCAAVLRLPGSSKGADGEVQLAESLGIPVFNDIDKLTEFFKQAIDRKDLRHEHRPGEDD